MSLFLGLFMTNHLIGQMAILCLQCAHWGGLWRGWEWGVGRQGGMAMYQKTHQLIQHMLLHDQSK